MDPFKPPLPSPDPGRRGSPQPVCERRSPLQLTAGRADHPQLPGICLVRPHDPLPRGPDHLLGAPLPHHSRRRLHDPRDDHPARYHLHLPVHPARHGRCRGPCRIPHREENGRLEDRPHRRLLYRHRLGAVPPAVHLRLFRPPHRRGPLLHALLPGLHLHPRLYEAARGRLQEARDTQDPCYPLRPDRGCVPARPPQHTDHDPFCPHRGCVYRCAVRVGLLQAEVE